MTLKEAFEHVKWEFNSSPEFTKDDFYDAISDEGVAEAIATILNAVVKGELKLCNVK